MRAAVVLVATIALSGCASDGSHRKLPTAAERGHEVARAACAACHAVDRGGVSAQARAPGFASAEMQHMAGIQGRVAELTRLGHYGMPPVRLSPSQAADLVAYVESLSRPDGARRGGASERLSPAA